MELLERLKALFAGIIRFNRESRDLREIFDDWRSAIARTTPAQRKRYGMVAGFGIAPVLIIAILGGWLVLRPTPTPDYTTANIADIFNFTFLTSEFNRLPVEERLELIGQLIERMNGMSASESVMVAAFAAGIAGKARQQIEANTSRLMIDLWDKYALDYAQVAPENRGAFLDASMIELAKTMEAMGGQVRDISDADRLAEIRRQARRDHEIMRGENAPPPQMMGRMFNFMRDNIGSRASPAQRLRAQQLIVDMTRHARGAPVGGG